MSCRPFWSFVCRSSRSRRRSEEHTSELQSHSDLVCRLLLEKKTVPRPGYPHGLFGAIKARNVCVHRPEQWPYCRDEAITKSVAAKAPIMRYCARVERGLQPD